MSRTHRTRCPRLAVNRMEDRTMPSTGFVGPLQFWNEEPRISAVRDERLAITGDVVPSQPAFDAFGTALPQNKSRIDSDLLRLYNAWQTNGPDWAAEPFQASDLLQVDANGYVQMSITARDTRELRPSLVAAGFRVDYELPAQHLFQGPRYTGRFR